MTYYSPEPPITPITVAELIVYLQTIPQDLIVAHKQYSEQCLLEIKKICIETHTVPRSDGWIHDWWDSNEDKQQQTYLVFPGN